MIEAITTLNYLFFSRSRSMSHAAVCIITREGPQGFFRGIVPSLLLVAPQTGMQFAIYHTFNQIVDHMRNYFDPSITGSSSQSHSSNHSIGTFD
ncbi:unnamed protein product [Heterobilharzia americana]|nr:unnamed protein product [Heterobilharzia americana]